MNQDLSRLSIDELKALRQKLQWEVSKYSVLETAIKLILNSCYGAVGNEYGRWYDTRLAEAVTLCGQYISSLLYKRVNEFLNADLGTEGKDFVVAGDTDSMYIRFDEVVQKFAPGLSKWETVDFLDQYGKEKIQKVIDNTMVEIAEYMNVFQNKLSMKREVIADRGFWVAKKNYALWVYVSEKVRYSEPKRKVKGLQVVRSGTPQACKKPLYEVVDLILTKDNNAVIDFISDFKAKFKKLSPVEIAANISCNSIEEYSQDVDVQSSLFSKFSNMFTGNSGYEVEAESGTPNQVKGAILFNNLIDKFDLDTKYPKVSSGEKIKTLLLVPGNPAKETVISLIDQLPVEFGLEKYIDYNAQFEKVFLKPVKTMLEAIGWKHEKRGTLFGTILKREM